MHFLPYLYEMRFRLLAACVLVCVSAGCSFLVPYLFKVTIDILSVKESTTAVFMAMILCGYGVCWIVNHLLMQLRIVMMYSMLERSKKILSEAVFNKLLSLTTRFHTARKTGELTTALEKAHHGLDAIFWGVLLFLLPTCIEIIIMMYVMSSSCGMMHGVALLLVILLYSYVNYRALSAMTTLQSNHNQASAHVASRLFEVLLNIETVKYFAREKYEQDCMNQLLQQQESCAIKRWKADAWIQLQQMLIIGIGIWAVTVYTGYAVYVGNLTLGTFILINTYLLQCMMPLGNIGYVMHQVRKGVQDMRAVVQILQEEPELQNPKKPCALVAIKPQLIMRNVSFGYTPERMILHNISFSVHPGQTLAFVGPSGSGKSTIAQLILRMYDPSSGTILLNNTDIRTITQQSLRTMIGIVAQDTMLFNTTLYENITYGDLGASAQAVHEAAEKVQLSTLIASLPQGYTTVVGERGVKLSGGEKQRIALARVLLKKPLLYIFDEATSSLDSRTEKDIQKHIRALSAETTTIIIAHRLSTIIHADQILVLDQGRVVEQGTHETLLQRNTLYARLWDAQQFGIAEKFSSSNHAHYRHSEAVLER